MFVNYRLPHNVKLLPRSRIDLMLFVKKTRFWLFIALLALSPLSKFPYLPTPNISFTSFRFGFYQLLALTFVLFCLPPLLAKLKSLFWQNKIAFSSALVILAILPINLLFDVDIKRGALFSASIVMLIALAASGWWFVSFGLPKKENHRIIRIILTAGIVFGLLSLLEFLLLTLTDVKSSIICNGCYASIFGFPRINLFAAEPQFLANAMLPFLFVSLGSLLRHKTNLSTYCLALSTLTISLTFSRGAYLALLVGLAAFFMYLISVKKLVIKVFYTALFIIVTAFLVGWLMLVWSAHYRHNLTPNITYNTVDTMLDHATLGLIDLPAKKLPETENVKDDGFVPPGLISSSNTDRTTAATLALNSWNTNIKTILLGAGSGNLGPFTVKHVYTNAPYDLTVYIYYILLLAEIGLLGLAAFLLIYLSALQKLVKQKTTSSSAVVFGSVFALTIAFLIQYWFFGTFINNVYIWLWLGVALGLSAHFKTKKAI